MPHHYLSTNATVALQRRFRKVKEWCTSSYPTYDTGEYEPTWVSARRVNFASCRFYQLPEELILQILNSLDYVSKAMAMRTCGVLLRIMFDRTLFSQAYKSSSVAHFLIWPPFEPRDQSISIEDRRALRQQVNHLLNRDRFCDPCRLFREGGRYEKAMLALQTTLWCSHCETTHKRPFFSPQQRATSSATRVCVLVEGKSHVCAHKSIDLDSIPNVVSTSKDICRHAQHDFTWFSRWENAAASAPSPEDERPCVQIDNHSQFLSLQAGTTIFLFRLRHAVPVTWEWLYERLTEKGHLLDTMLCPHVRASDGQLLLPFSPDRCACFGRHQWIHPSCSSDNCLCCRCSNSKRSSPTTYFMLKEFDPWEHLYQCSTCQARYYWRREGSAVYLEIEKRSTHFLTLTKRANFSSWCFRWLNQLDPESWGILDDKELHHVAWCEDVNCATRWRWEKLLRLLKDK